MVNNLIEEAEKVLFKTYNRYQIILDKGEGVYLYDINGKKYLDFSAGIGVYALGYANIKFNNALKQQIDKLLHTSNYYYNLPSINAAKKITKVSGMDRVFFTNSGTEAVEGAIKLARRYYYDKYNIANSEIISMNSSFHGRSMGALSVTGTKKYREPFEPLIGGVKFANFNDIESVKSLINKKTAAIILEPIQGEGGIYPADKDFINEVKKICVESDILLIFDEIQCGMGRTGEYFAYQYYNVKPDVLTVAKALGCGVPVGAFLATEKVAGYLVPGDHGTTYGGNPFVTEAVNKVIEIYEEDEILKKVKEVSGYLFEKLEEVKSKHDIIVDHRGIGLMQGLEFSIPVGPIINKAIENGLILIAAGTNVIRFLPPLIIKKEEIDEMINILIKSLK